jgi:nicotinamide-nucleotide amidase
MHAEVISIGTEILMGEIVDTNSGYLASELAEIGVEVCWVTKVGDDPERLFEAVDRAWNRSDVTITSGGLGPTSDDLTRESIARVMGEQMVVQDDLLAHLKSQFEGRGFPMPATNIKQATLIDSADAIPNPLGTAPGWWVHRNGKVIAAMPGPTRELYGMWGDQVGPKIKTMNPDVSIVTRTLKTFGITEGGLDEMLSPLFGSINPTLGIYSKEDGIHLRAIATARTSEEAYELIEPMETEICDIVGDAVWGVDDQTAASMAIEALKAAGKTLGVIEGFTGGMFASTLTDVAGSADIFRGGMVASRGEFPGSNDIPIDAGIAESSPDTDIAAAMAEAARALFQADVGVGVTSLVTRPSPTSGEIDSAHMAFTVGRNVTTRSGRYPVRRSRFKARAVTNALLELTRALRDI